MLIQQYTNTLSWEHLQVITTTRLSWKFHAFHGSSEPHRCLVVKVCRIMIIWASFLLSYLYTISLYYQSINILLSWFPISIHDFSVSETSFWHSIAMILHRAISFLTDTVVCSMLPRDQVVLLADSSNRCQLHRRLQTSTITQGKLV